ncbi:MAG: SMP-30/gluconolactonase/LRE family protein [Pseudomonadota bacterium]|nr:SMP-30/gluconolactonase/LRE family protein [Pseudomonadota bacterium]MEE3101382.1 SMP-30/gluconolactonase/LRE family protein [Pseudomonadota bacterium]
MGVRATDPEFWTLVQVGVEARPVCSGFVFTEGPVWHPVDRVLIFSDIKGDARYRWRDGSEVRRILTPTRQANGLTLDADLNLIACEHLSSVVARFRPDGAREVLASHFEGRALNSPNDVVCASDGSIWFTDPTYGRTPPWGDGREPELDFRGLYRLAPGHRPGAEPQLVAPRDLFRQPNGLCFSPDEAWLYVDDTVAGTIRRFAVGADGTLGPGELFAARIAEPDGRPGVPDGIKCDEAGNVWVTAPGGVWVYSPDGRKLGEVDCPEQAANLAWGGDDGRTLHLTARSSVYALPTLVRGREEPFLRGRRV